MKNHPDKGGDPEEFKKIAGAWDVLGDDKKRKLYDKYGKKGLEAGGNPQGDMDDMMSMFFGGGRGRRSSEPSGPKKGKPVVHPLRISLKDLYKGKTMRMRITRNIITRRGEDEPVDMEEVEDTLKILGQSVSSLTPRPDGLQLYKGPVATKDLKLMNTMCTSR